MEGNTHHLFEIAKSLSGIHNIAGKGFLLLTFIFPLRIIHLQNASTVIFREL